MKKLLLFVATMLLVFSMVACGGSDDSGTTKATNENNKSENKTDKVTDDDNKETEKGDTATPDSGDAKLMFEYEKIKVSLASVGINEDGELIADFIYENSGQKHYEIYLKYVIVNGIQIEETVPIKRLFDNRTETGSYEVRDYTMKFFNISEIKTCTFSFSVTEAYEDEELYCTNLMYVYGDESIPAQVLEGPEILNENGIRMYIVEVFESSNGPSFKICVENTHDRDVRFTRVSKTTEVNGNKVNDSMYGYVAANSKMMFHYYISTINRQDLGIESWDDIQTIKWTIDAYYRDTEENPEMIFDDHIASVEVQGGKVIE